MTDEEKEAIDYKRECEVLQLQLHLLREEKDNLIEKKDKIIEKMAERVYLKKEEYECVRENQRNNIHKSFEDCIIEYFE